MIKNIVTAEINSKVESSFLLWPSKAIPLAATPWITKQVSQNKPIEANNSFIFGHKSGSTYKIFPFCNTSMTVVTRVIGWSRVNTSSIGVPEMWYPTHLGTFYWSTAYHSTLINDPLDVADTTPTALIYQPTGSMSLVGTQPLLQLYKGGSTSTSNLLWGGGITIDGLGSELIEIDFKYTGTTTGFYPFASAFVTVF